MPNDGAHSLGGYGLFAGLPIEVVVTLMFLFVIMGAPHDKAAAVSPRLRPASP